MPLFLQTTQTRWSLLMILGILLVLLGIFALLGSVVTTLLSVNIVGLLLVASGFLMLVHAAQSRHAPGVWMSLALGVLYTICGFVLFRFPVLGAVTLTMVMALFFMLSGFLRCILAITQRFSRRGLFFLGGLITLILGILIWFQLPLSGLYIIGLFVGIDLMFMGWGMILLSDRIHHLKPPVKPSY